MRQIFVSIIRHNCLRLKEHALVRSRDDDLKHRLLTTCACLDNGVLGTEKLFESCTRESTRNLIIRDAFAEC